MTLYLNGAIFNEDKLIMFSDKQIIQTGETANLKAIVVDDNRNPIEGVTVEFYEVVTPTLTMSANRTIFQSGETIQLYCKVKDEDGSLVKGQTVEFYKEV